MMWISSFYQKFVALSARENNEGATLVLATVLEALNKS